MRRRTQINKAMLGLAGAGALVLLISFAVPTRELPAFDACLFRLLSDKPCFGCGLTRGICSISDGRFLAAWNYNPFSFAVYLGLALLVFQPVIAQSYPGLLTRVYSWKRLPVVTVAFAVAMMTFGVLRFLWQP